MPTPDEERERLRYLQLKAKAASAPVAPAEPEPEAPPEEPSLAQRLMTVLATRGHATSPTFASGMAPLEDAGHKAIRYGSGMVDLGATTLAKPFVKAAQSGLPKNSSDFLENYLPSTKVANAAASGKPYDNATLWKDELKLPEGGSVSDIPGLSSLKGSGADLTTRGSMATLASLGLDPANEVSAASEALQPIAKGLNTAGRAVYRNGFRKVSAAPLKFKNAEAIGEHAFPDLAYDEKMFSPGSAADLLSQLKSYLHDNIGPKYNAIIDSPEVSGLRAKIEDTLGRTIPNYFKTRKASSFGDEAGSAFGDRMMADRALDTTHYPDGRNARELLDRAKDYSDAARGKIGAVGDAMKTGVSKPAKNLLMDFAQDQRNAAAELAERGIPGAKAEVQGLNRKYSIAKPAIEPLISLATNEQKKYPLTQVKGGLLAHGVDAARWLGGMLGGQYLNSPSGAVRIGNALRGLSGTGIWDNMARRGFGVTTPEDQ